MKTKSEKRATLGLSLPQDIYTGISTENRTESGVRLLSFGYSLKSWIGGYMRKELMMSTKTYEELEVGDKIQALPNSMYTFDFYPEGNIGYVTEIMDEGTLKADFSGKHRREGLYFLDGEYKILEEKKQTKGNGVAMIYWADTNEFVKEVPVQIDVKVTLLEE